jgi:hypothetical protein
MQAAEPDPDRTIAITNAMNVMTFPSTDEGRRVLWDRKLKGFGIRVNPNRTRPT